MVRIGPVGHNFLCARLCDQDVRCGHVRGIGVDGILLGVPLFRQIHTALTIERQAVLHLQAGSHTFRRGAHDVIADDEVTGNTPGCRNPRGMSAGRRKDTVSLHGDVLGRDLRVRAETDDDSSRGIHDRIVVNMPSSAVDQDARSSRIGDDVA